MKRGSWIQIPTQNIIWYNTNYVRKNIYLYLAIILLLVKYRFQNHWSAGKHNAKARTVNVYVTCFAIIVVQENIWIPFVTLTYLCTLYLSVINFIPIIRVLVIETQSLVMLICVRWKKIWENNWHVPCLVEEKETFVRWFSSSVN